MRSILPAAALAIAVSLPAAAQQQVESLGVTITTNVALTTDYLFRGISQTRGGPAIQGSLDIEHASGFYIGGFASNVDFLGLDANIETDVMAGFRFTVADVKVDVGGIYYAYPGYTRPTGGYRLDFFEAALRLSYEAGPATFVGAFYWSPDYQLESRNAYYVEGGIDLKLPGDFTLSGRVGHQSIERSERFGTPASFANFAFVLSREIYGFNLSVGFYDTTISRRECGGGQNICGARVVGTVSRRF